ncbi:MAG: hypothetical protein Q9218_000297 [Villophora microphyllina]
MPLVGGHRYLASTAVFLCEILKLTICLTLALYDISRTMSPSTPVTSLFGGMMTAVFIGDSWKLAIPASLYVLQNSLQYLAISNLDTAVFQVTYQFKILPTALFSVIFLRRSLSLRKWLALALLMLGVAIVQLPATGQLDVQALRHPHNGYHITWSLEGFRGVGTAASDPLNKRSATYEGIQADAELEHPEMNTSLGITAALMGCVVSSLASVYFEKILKDSIHPVSLWIRNVQLAFYSMFPALFIGVFYVDGERIARNGFFAGYNWAVWTTLGFQAVGGMVVSLCLSYADNIAKTFAMSISILISLCASICFFEFKMSRNFVIGTSIVLLATYLYNVRERGPRPPPLQIHEYEKTVVDPKPSYDIDGLLREMNGTGQHHDVSQHARPVSTMNECATTSTNQQTSMPYLFPQSAADNRPSVHHGEHYPQKAVFRDYDDQLDASLDAFGNISSPSSLCKAAESEPTDQALLAETEASTQQLNGVRKDFWSEADQKYGGKPYFSGYPPNERLPYKPGQPFQTPPSQVAIAHSSPAYPVTSSPLAGITQRREAQVTQTVGQSFSNNAATFGFPSFRDERTRGPASTINLSHAPPVVQGIQLVAPTDLPDRFRSVFPFPLFNAVQSKCFRTAYQTSDNLVLSAPTGSGKTVILELSICRLISGFQTNQFKIVYMAPTKSLCAERQKDWQAKFASLDLQCAELTGDTDQGQLRNVQNASIVITTPEKWDSMTRKWKDHIKLMQLVKLFLIDEVHILKETRGACLEAVVSRMKSVGTDVRFVALSATVPNSDDIATWLGQNSTAQSSPAHRKRFGEEFRPVKLQKHVYGLPFSGNDWGFERICDPKLPEIIAKHSQKKPLMIFCITRKSTVSTAKLLANWWAMKGPRERYWSGPTFRLIAQDPDLKETLTAGVAFHHAGLDAPDRHAIEKGFLEGQVNVICCTSTLAVGVNLPCHMAIIKNTVCFTDEGLKEYSDLEVMQMLGRAGRPQFGDSAVAVIITKQEKVQKYEKMVSGQELLESNLHLNLIEHLNAEIGLGTIYNIYTAKRWLAGTFLYVRLGQNPAHYKLDGDGINLNVDDRIERVCQRDIALLLEEGLVTKAGDRIECTEFGDAMARYYVDFETMKGLLSLEPRSKMSDILSVLVGAEEFRDVRYRAMEKKLLKHLNGANGTRYPIKVDIALSQHKRSLIIQSELGGVEFPADEQHARFKRQYQQDKSIIFNHIHRLIRCVIDCQIHLQDAVNVRHALELARSFAARVWDNSAHQLKQIPNIGPVAIRRLANGGINSIETLEAAEASKIEMLLSKNAPFGSRVLAALTDFPKLRVSVKMMGKDFMHGQPVKIKIRAEVGFMNTKSPMFFQRKAIHICFLAERSDGHLIDFRRISAKKLSNGQDVLISAELLQHTQYVTCYVMCDEIAGTMRYAELKPGLAPSIFPAQHSLGSQSESRPSLLRKASKQKSTIASPSTVEGDERLYDDGVADEDIFEAATNLDFNTIEAFEAGSKPGVTQSRVRSHGGNTQVEEHNEEWTPTQLGNGKWKCVDKPPKPPKSAVIGSVQEDTSSKSQSRGAPKQSTIPNAKQTGKPALSKATKDVETVDLSHKRDLDAYDKVAPRAYRSLHRLHEKTSSSGKATIASNTKPTFSYKKSEQPSFTFLSQLADSDGKVEGPSSDYEAGWMDDLPSPSALVQTSNDKGSRLEESTSGNHELLCEDGTFAFQDDSHDKKDFFKAQPLMNDSHAEMSNSFDEGLEETVGPLNSAEDFKVSQYFNDEHGGHKTVQTGDPKLFMSTDSPEKPSSPPIKRKMGEVPSCGIGEADLAPPPKKTKQHSALQPTASEDNEALETAPAIKPGYPDWVYEFDPAFVAEWEPYVEFV